MTRSLRPQQGRLFSFLSEKKEGDLFTAEEILHATGWKPATLRTHQRKNFLSPFLQTLPDGRFRALQDGSVLSKGQIAAAFTQVRRDAVALKPGITLIGQQGQYQLTKKLGEGAVAHVWEASRVDKAGQCAIKVMNPRADLLDPSHVENIRRRFSREVRHGMRLEHANIVRYIDYGELAGNPFLVMELAIGSVLSLLRNGPLDERAARQVVNACVHGLKYLHRKDCIHRDIKPANILQTQDRFMLGDLGIVRWAELNPAFTSAGTITRASVQLGSWYYMSPEQRRGPHQVKPATDIYSLGITWYEMLTGRTLDPAQVVAGDFPEPCQNPLTCSLIKQMLSYDPKHRPGVEHVLQEIGRP